MFYINKNVKKNNKKKYTYTLFLQRRNVMQTICH